VKRTSRKQRRHGKSEPSPDQIRRYLDHMADEHQLAWHTELLSAAPEWVYLLGLHLRLVELEHLQEGAAVLL
jgi:hypothetical protein